MCIIYNSKGRDMDINVKRFGVSGLLVKVNGRIDLDNAGDFGITIRDQLDDILELVIDFSDVTFISSFGLKVLLELYKQMKIQEGTMKLTNVPENIYASLNMVGFDKFLTIE